MSCCKVRCNAGRQSFHDPQVGAGKDSGVGNPVHF